MWQKQTFGDGDWRVSKTQRRFEPWPCAPSQSNGPLIGQSSPCMVNTVELALQGRHCSFSSVQHCRVVTPRPSLRVKTVGLSLQGRHCRFNTLKSRNTCDLHLPLTDLLLEQEPSRLMAAWTQSHAPVTPNRRKAGGMEGKFGGCTGGNGMAWMLII